jgi:hypothetical protein
MGTGGGAVSMFLFQRFEIWSQEGVTMLIIKKNASRRAHGPAQYVHLRRGRRLWRTSSSKAGIERGMWHGRRR